MAEQHSHTTSEAIECSCRKASVFRSDYEAHGVQYVNRHCNGCGAHWHGQIGAVVAYTRAEWDDELARAAKPLLFRLRDLDANDLPDLANESMREAHDWLERLLKQNSEAVTDEKDVAP